VDTLVTVLVPALVALAATMVAVVAASRLGERRARRHLLKRIGGAKEARAGANRGSSTEIFLQSAAHAGRWWRLVQRTPFLQGSDQLLQQAGLDWSAARLARLVALSASVVGVVGFAIARTPTAVLLGIAVGMLLPVLYVRRRRARRLRVMEEQLPEAIDLLGRAIRAGHALATGLRLVGEESPDPLASEFRRVFEEQKYGMRFEESILSLARRVDLVDVRVMVVAILVQREVGGNLAEILDKLSHLIRTRFGLRRQVRVYTAQGRMSGWVLAGLPVALGVIIHFLNPGYIELLFTAPSGRLMLAVAVGMQLMGYFWISRILKLDL
jgi:tight adherence protein B